MENKTSELVKFGHERSGAISKRSRSYRELTSDRLITNDEIDLGQVYTVNNRFELEI